MNDSEFIELLNLYLDHEISAADAARLEAEVKHNPEHRQVYQQYCRMQKACTLLAMDFVEQPTANERKLVGFESRPAWRNPVVLGFGGLAAAAACVALVLMNRPFSAETSTQVAANAPSPALDIAAVESKIVVTQAENVADHANISHTVTVAASRRNDLQPVLVTRGLTLTANFGAQSQIAAGESASQLDWINGLKIAPMQTVQPEDLRFEAHPNEAAKNSVFGTRGRPAQQGIVEMTAFQFGK
jgi:ferric-dicitrate binding protein FerR (iron transport regulator)